MESLKCFVGSFPSYGRVLFFWRWPSSPLAYSSAMPKLWENKRGSSFNETSRGHMLEPSTNFHYGVNLRIAVFAGFCPFAAPSHFKCQRCKTFTHPLGPSGAHGMLLGLL